MCNYARFSYLCGHSPYELHKTCEVITRNVENKVNDPCEPVYDDKVVADVFFVCSECMHRLPEFFDQWGNLVRGGEDYNAPSSESRGRTRYRAA